MNDFPEPHFLSDPYSHLSAQIRAIKIVMGALLLGWLMSATILAIATQLMPSPVAKRMALTYVGVIIAAGGLLARRFVDGMIVEMRLRGLAGSRSTLNTGNAEESAEDARKRRAVQVFAVMRQWLILRTAVLEAVSLFQIVVYFIERSPLSLALAALLFLPAIVSFPTTSGVRRWIDSRLRALEEKRLQPQLGL